MKYMRAVFLGTALVGSAASVAAAQNLVPVQYYDRDDRQAFREGYRQGQFDARRGRRADWDDNRWREADDRRAYRDGYLRGYREVQANFRPDGDRRDGYIESARRLGYEDGVSDGSMDRRTGHSFRPMHDDNYRHADRGYYSGFGSKNYYKQIYREGYEQGYRQGYDNGWRH